MSSELIQANWNYPTAIRVGAGRITELPDVCLQLGIRQPLLVTDPGLADLDMTRAAQKACNDAGLQCGIFSEIQGNPTGSNIEAGAAVFRNEGHDGVIAFGGGSAMDAGKAIALVAEQELPLFAFVDEGDNWTRANADKMAPVVAVPTTAGTGSEVGRASVITEEERHLKRIIFHPNMLPERVILDPELTVGLPSHITAATGMDALSHNLEALCAPFYHPMAEGIANEGIRLVQQFLPRACADGSDIEARTQMLVASTMGATAFQRGLGGMHALAHTLGGLYDAHHGLLNAILMPYVLKANEAAVTETLTRTSRYLDLQAPGFAAFLDWVLAMREQLGIPDALAAIAIPDSEADRIGQLAVLDAAAGGNPVELSAQQYRKIFINALEGCL